MRRRIQAVPRAGNGRCDCGPIGVRLARNGRPGPAVGPGTEDGGGAIQGPFFQTSSAGMDGDYGQQIFRVNMDGLLGAESILWSSPDYGYAHDPLVDGNPIVSFSNPSDGTPDMTVRYDPAGGYAFVTYQCSVDGVVYRGNAEVWSAVTWPA